MSICLALTICGCGFTTGSSNGPPPGSVTVSVSPQTASVSLGQTVQFTATVTGTSANELNWSVNKIAGGNASIGTISAAGLYTAPQAMPPTSSMTVTATTQSPPLASGSATVQIQSGIAVSIMPNSATLDPGGTANFTATVSGAGTGSSAVSWSVNGISRGNASVGTLSITGTDTATYAAPAIPPAPTSVSVVATSVTDPTKAAASDVTISCGYTSSISPSSASIATGTKEN